MPDDAPRATRRPARRRTAALAALLTALALTGAAGCTAPPTSDPARAEKTGPVVVRAHQTPTALEVPAIGVRTTALVEIGLTPSGKMQVPGDAATTGWFGLGPVPGEPGPSVIAAHVDYRGVDGVFARLHETAIGDIASVTRADGTIVRFTVYRVERYAKAAFPTREVYGNTTGPELRLVTCGGDFDRTTGHYRDNVVVFARRA